MNEKIISLKRNTICCNLIEGKADSKVSSKIGGKPYLPKQIEWYYVDNESEIHPLTFLAQINLEELDKYDIEHELPSKGMLYFFMILTKNL